MNRDELFKMWGDTVQKLENLAEKIKNDDGQRVAFVYIGDKREYPQTKMDYLERYRLSKKIGKEILPYDDRKWAMVNQEDGKGAKLTLIDETLPSIEDARKWGYKESDYKPVGKVNIYTDILGKFSTLNSSDKPALEESALDEAVQEWYSRSYVDDKNIIAGTKIAAENSAKEARKTFEDYKP